MQDRDLPNDLLDLILGVLPPEPPISPLGGRPRIARETVLKVIWFVMKTGIAYRDVPRAMGCCGETARTAIKKWEIAGVWKKVARLIHEKLNSMGALDLDAMIIDSTQVRAFGGGSESGPSPVDRRKPGTKFTLLVDANGIPLVIKSVKANKSDHTEMFPTIAMFTPIKGRVGRPKAGPKTLIADAGYDSEAARRLLRWMGIEPKIRKRASEHGSGLGKVRYVVERTIHWLKGIRRFRFRYDRSLTMLDAVRNLTLIFVCFRILTRTNAQT